MVASTWVLVVIFVVGGAFSALGIAYSRRLGVGLEQYLTARGSTRSLSTMATMVASIIGAWVLFSPAEAATWAGVVALIGYGAGQASPIFAMAILGSRMRSLIPEGHSLTEFVWLRYGKAMLAVTLVIMLLYLFTFLAAEMAGIARAIQLVSGTPLVVTIGVVGLATLAYTVYGGLRASIFTDNLQFLLILPLLVVLLGTVLFSLGGWSTAFSTVREVRPELLSFSHRPGIEFGITLVIAILAANLFHQGFWQRVYAAESDRALNFGFVWAGILVIPLVIVTGLFGIWAVGRGVADQPAIALFSLALDVLPGWAVITLVLLALVLVMSSMDTLLNGIASSITATLPLVKPGTDLGWLLRSSRGITIVLSIPAMVVAALVDSVLYLFLIADLVTAGAVVPVFLGMFARRFTGRMALISTIAGIAIGALFFPTPPPDLAGWWHIPVIGNWWDVLRSGSLLASFLAAVVVSSIVAGALLLWARDGQPYDFSEFRRRIRLLER